MAVIRTCCEGACRKKGSISGKIGVDNRVGISSRVDIDKRVGIEASSNKDAFRPPKVPLLYRALSMVYSKGVGK